MLACSGRAVRWSQRPTRPNRRSLSPAAAQWGRGRDDPHDARAAAAVALRHRRPRVVAADDHVAVLRLVGQAPPRPHRPSHPGRVPASHRDVPAQAGWAHQAPQCRPGGFGAAQAAGDRRRGGRAQAPGLRAGRRHPPPRPAATIRDPSCLACRPREPPTKPGPGREVTSDVGRIFPHNFPQVVPEEQVSPSFPPSFPTHKDPLRHDEGRKSFRERAGRRPFGNETAGQGT